MCGLLLHLPVIVSIIGSSIYIYIIVWIHASFINNCLLSMSCARKLLTFNVCVTRLVKKRKLIACKIQKQESCACMYMEIRGMSTTIHPAVYAYILSVSKRLTMCLVRLRHTTYEYRYKNPSTA